MLDLIGNHIVGFPRGRSFINTSTLPDLDQKLQCMTLSTPKFCEDDTFLSLPFHVVVTSVYSDGTRTIAGMLKPLTINTISLYVSSTTQIYELFFRSISATVTSDLNWYEDDCIDVEAADGKLSIDEWAVNELGVCEAENRVLVADLRRRMVLSDDVLLSEDVLLSFRRNWECYIWNCDNRFLNSTFTFRHMTKTGEASVHELTR